MTHTTMFSYSRGSGGRICRCCVVWKAATLLAANALRETVD